MNHFFQLNRMIAVLLSLGLLIGGCSQDSSLTNSVLQTNYVQNLIQAEVINDSMIARRRERHERAQFVSRPDRQYQNHILKREPNRQDPFRGQKSMAQVNGQVIAMFDAWIPEGRDFDRVVYVLYKFLSPETVETGVMSTESGESSYTTELWRYHEGTWCAVMPYLPLNIKSAVARKIQATKDGVHVQLITGSNDGVFGEIGLLDQHPADDTCLKSAALPLEQNKTSYYDLLHSENGNDVFVSRGPVLGMQLVDVLDVDDKNKIKKSTDRVLYGWSAKSCQTKPDSSTSSGCERDKVLGSDLWVGYLKDNDKPGIIRMEKLISANEQKAEDMLGIGPSNITGIDSIFYRKPANNLENHLIVNYGPAEQKGFLTIEKQSPATDFSSFQMTSAKWQVLGNEVLESYPNPWKDNYGTLYRTLWGNIDSSEPQIWSPVLDQPVKSKINPSQYALGPQATYCGYQYGHILCTAFNSDVPGNMFAFRGNIPIDTKNPAGSYKYIVESRETYYGGLQFARIEPLESHLEVGQETKSIFSVRPVVYTSDSSNDSLGLAFSNARDKKKTTNEMSLYLGVPNSVAGTNYFADYEKNKVFGAELRDLSVFETKIKGTNIDKVFIIGRFADSPDVIVSDKALHRAGGGVFLCVTEYLDKAEGLLNMKLCEQDRKSVGQVNPLSQGTSVARSFDVVGGGNDMLAPVYLSKSISPDGVVYLNYISASGGIFTINATTSVGDQFRSWSRISTGRVTSCTQTFNKIEIDLRNDESKSPRWWKQLRAGLVTDGAFAIALLVPGIGEIASVAIELGFEYWEAAADSGDDKSSDKTKLEIDPRKGIKTSCGVS